MAEKVAGGRTVMTYREKTIAVVIPAYNEEKLIRRTINTLPDFVDRVIVVDDCSTDRTNDIVRYMALDYPKGYIDLIEHTRNRGPGAAAKTGYIEAIKKGCDIICLMDGDAQMDPNDLDRIIDPVIDGDADYSKGNRFVIPIWKYFGNVILSWMTRVLTGYKISDCQGNYSAISLRALKNIGIRDIYDDYGFPNDILCRLSEHGFRVKDVNTNPIYGIGEVTGIKLHRVIPRISLLFARLFYRKLTGRMG